MSDQNTVATSESEEPKGAIPQDVANEIAALGAEVQALRDSAARAQKTTAIIFVIILVVIAGYLSFIYAQLRPLVTPETLVQAVVDRADELLAENGLPSLKDHDVGEKVSAMLREKAPDFVRDMVKPRWDELVDRFKDEQTRGDMVASIKGQIDKQTDKGVVILEENVLPRLREMALNSADKRMEQILDQFEEQFQSVINKVVNENQANLIDLKPESKPALTDQLIVAFRDAMGKDLEKLFGKLEAHLVKTEESFADMLKKGRMSADDKSKVEALDAQITAIQEGKLTEEEELKIVALQIISRLFEKAEGASTE